MNLLTGASLLALAKSIYYKLIYRIKTRRMSANKIFMFLIKPPSGNAKMQNMNCSALKKEKRKTAKKNKYSTY